MTIDWTHLTPASAPAARFSQAAAYDPVRDVVVLFGGRDFSGSWPATETWEWDGTNWAQKSPTHHPTTNGITYPLFHAAYLAALGGVVIFYGSSTNYPTKETWWYDGTDWTQIGGTQPGTTTHFAVDFAFGPDIAHDKVVLYEPQAQETWLFDGTTWTNAAPSTTPPQDLTLMGPCMMWDYANGNLVMFVTPTYTGSPVAPSTFIWDGTDWTDAAPVHSPDGRRIPSITWSENLNSIVLFGGFSEDGTTYLNDTWLWDGTDWTALTTVSHPGVRETYDMLAFDPGTRSVVLFGGEDNNSTVYSDTWILFDDAPGLDTGTGSGTCAIAELSGQITSAFDGTWWYDYGLTTGYGSTSTGGSFLAGITDVTEDLSGLTAGVTYHFRLSVTTVEGTFHGPDATWDEGACPPVTVNCEFIV